ncbi:carboxypeptidase-like regulatory domain-containing protein [Aquiflexum sp.]|uniref:carboxypeptidase-like regulatory domain-containing protein n=1 Tax=Aquiflexum sp. TaxID=1872584 RepID=UPI0035939EB6
MNKSVIIPVRLLLLSLVLSSAMGISNAQQYTIKGTLRNGANDEFITGAVITLRETAFSDISNNVGAFMIENVFEEKFILNIQINGFQSYKSQITVNGDLNLGIITLFPFGYEDDSGEALQKTIRATNVAELFSKRPNFEGGHAVFGIPPDPKRLIGNFYLDTKWNKASILLYKDDEIIEGYFVRYNINSNNFELRAEDSDEATAIAGHRVRNIVWVDSKHRVPRYFVNGMDLKDEGVPIAGFFEVLVDGKMPLVRRTVASIKESNYNAALMVGNRNDEIIKRFVYYYIQDNNLFEIPKKKKKVFQIFGEKSKEMEAFAIENNMSLREPSNWFNLITHYNNKFEGFKPLLPDLIDN